MSETKDTPHTDAPRGRHPLRRIAMWVAGLLVGPVVLLALAGLGLLWYAKGQSFDAPEWVTTRVETRIAQSLSNVEIGFDKITLNVSEDWQPSLHLTNMNIRPRGRATPITLSDVTGSIDPAALLEGQLRPKVITVTGTRIMFRRTADGTYGVALDAPADTAAQEIGPAIDALSELLDHPALSELSRIEGSALTMRYEDERSGRAWTVDGGRLELTREGNELHLRGDFAVLGGHDYATTGDVSLEGHMYSRAVTLAVRVADAAARDIATQSAGLAWLGLLDAPISGALRVSTDDDGVIGPLFGTLQIGAGHFAPGEAGEPVPFSSARTYFQYDPATLTLNFDELAVSSDWVDTTAEGRVVLSDVVDGIPGKMTGQMRLTGLTANPADIFQTPLHFDGAEAEVRVTLDPFRVDIGRLDLRNRGEVFAAEGWLAAEPDGWDLSMTARMAELTTDDVLQLWPTTAVDKTREWVAQNVQGGTVTNLQVGVRSLPTERPDLTLGFDFQDLTTTFMRNMPPLQGASGRAELRGDRFVVTADEGRVYLDEETDGLSVAGTSFIYENVRVKQGPSQVLVRTEGDLTDILRLIDTEPLKILTKAGRGPDLATGRARVEADLAFPLIKKLPVDQIDVSYRAQLFDVDSDTIVPGQSLSAEQLEIEGTRTQLIARGQAKVGQVPAGGVWTADLTPGGTGSRLEGWVTVSQALNQQFNLGLPPETFDGATRAQVRMDFAKGKPAEFTASSDLAGLALRIAPLNWTLSRAQTGRAEIAGRLGSPPEIDRLSIDAPGLSAAGDLSLRPDNGGLERAQFSRVRLDGWLDAPVTLTGRGKGVPPKVTVSGGTVDLQQMNLGQNGGEGGPMTITLDRLQISEGLALRGFRGEFTNTGGLSGRFAATLNGAAPVNGVVAPQNGGSGVRVTSDNAGAVLSAAGLLNKGRGGALDLSLIPVGPKGTYDGRLNISEIWLQDAPAMASLLSALSIVGLLEQMSGNGILFNTVDADFRLTPAQVVVRSASAVGASMGVSIDGIYDLQRKVMDMQGVVSPLYVLNGLGRIFSRNKGEGLIGFNYNISGPVADPRVQVNPLSLFTPGMFREIFRRPPPTTN